MTTKQVIAEINSILRRNQDAAFLRHALTVLLAAEKAWSNRETGRASV